MALVKEPKVLLLDEQTSNLDLKYQIEIPLSSLEILKSGKVYALGKLEEALTAKNISEVYGVEPLIFDEYRLIVPLLYV